jgi:ABC-type phosphate transport system permease subunit
MSQLATTMQPEQPPPPRPIPQTRMRVRRQKLRTPLNAYGEPMVWLTGGALAICLAMVIGLLVFVVWMGLTTFWPAPVEKVTVLTGEIDPATGEEKAAVFMGEVTRDGWFTPTDARLENATPALRAALEQEMREHEGQVHRRLFRTGNYDLTNRHFRWIDEAAVIEDGRGFPEWAAVLERVEWGRFYGFPTRFTIDGETVATEPAAVWRRFNEHHADVRERWKHRKKLEEEDLGELYHEREQARLAVREVEIEYDLSPAWVDAYREWYSARLAVATPYASDEDRQDLQAAVERLERLERNAGPPPDVATEAFRIALQHYLDTIDETDQRNADIIAEIRELNAENDRYKMVLTTAQGREKVVPLDQIVRAYLPNQLDLGGKLGVYLDRWWEFLTAEPREANSEGGVFPAIIGTVIMTLIMAILVVPFGVMAAMYLREYAKAGPIISAVRIAINNLAGVPSIVFGVFGLGFFCYGVGGFIDGGPTWEMPRPTWFVVMAAIALVSVGAFLTMIASITKPGQPATLYKRIMRYSSGTLWLATALGAILLIATTPFFDGFFRASLPNPTFGKGALVWASFTLALLTLPVVIVATEEALAAVPNSMREGSYACGASKWQTIKRIVMPRAMPGIMTGMILAMARGAGEVAPLMLVGAVKLAPELPIALSPDEQFGINRSFMHLGFHIYDLGFQSQNSEAAKPLVFTTTLLLITIIAVLNLSAVWLRSRLRRKFVGTQF